MNYRFADGSIYYVHVFCTFFFLTGKIISTIRFRLIFIFFLNLIGFWINFKFKQKKSLNVRVDNYLVVDKDSM